MRSFVSLPRFAWNRAATRLAVLGLALVTAPADARADSTVEAEIHAALEGPQATPYRPYVTADLATFVEPAASAAAARLDALRTSASFGTAFPAAAGLLLTAGIDLIHTHHRWDDLTQLGPGLEEPIRDAYLVRLAPGFVLSLGEAWKVIASADLASSFGDDAAWDRSLTYGGIVVGAYRVSESLSLAGVLIATTRLDRDVRWLPVAGFEWNPTPSIVVELTGDTIGPTLRVQHRFAEHWSWSLAGRYGDEIYRIELAANEPGTFEHEQLTGLGGLTFSPSPRFTLDLQAGLAAGRRVEVNAAKTGRVGSLSFDPSPVFGLGMSLGF